MGVGPGWFWEQAADLLPDKLTIILADLSEGMIAEALPRVGAAKPGWQVHGIVAYAAALPSTATFDAVLSLHMLYHLPTPSDGVAELTRLVADGGFAVVTTNGEATLKELRELRTRLWPNAEQETICGFTLEAAHSLLADAFPGVEVHLHEETSFALMRPMSPPT